MDENKYNRLTYAWLAWPAMALLVFLLTRLALQKPEWVETIYSRGIYPVVAFLISGFSNLFPFSLSDLLYLLTGIYLLYSIVRIKKIKATGFLKRIIYILSLAYVFFHVLWGFNYYRPEVHERLGISPREIDEDRFMQEFQRIIERANSSYSHVEEWSQADIDSIVELSYSRLAEDLHLHYPGGKRRDKSITLSGFFAGAGIAGYYGPFFSEVHVNRKITALEYPFVLAHEKAHQFGVTSEAEANFFAWMVCTYSGNEALEYSAQLSILRFFLVEAYGHPDFKETLSLLDNRVKHDYRSIQANWQKLLKEGVDKVASKVNDAYLKSNHVENGIRDYTGVVKLILEFRAEAGE